jgi:hypothetical protein
MQWWRREATIVGLSCAAQICAAAPALPQTTGDIQSRWQVVFDTSARYYSWSNSLGRDGAQLYIPAAFQLTGRPSQDWKAEFLIRSGYIWSQQKSATLKSEASSMTDTTVSTTWSYYGITGVQPFAAISVNIPTANTTNSATDKTDSDIVASPTMGEGWNIGPSVGANIALNDSTIVSLGYGYTYRGPFDGGTEPASGTNITSVVEFNPGDVYTANAGFGWTGERTVVQVSVSYSIETPTYQAGQPLYRAGDRIIATAKAGQVWDQNWTTRGGFTFSHFDKNEIPMTGVPDLVRELFNSNSNVYRATLDHIFSKGNFAIGPTGTFLYRDRNGYDPQRFEFIPAKTSWAAGLAAQVTPSSNTAISLRAEHIWVDEDENPDKLSTANTIISGSGIPPIATRAWVVSLGGNVEF